MASAVERLVEAPTLHAVIGRGVRRVLLLRFPYADYFRVDANMIEVIAVLHHRRDAAEWRRR